MNPQNRFPVETGNRLLSPVNSSAQHFHLIWRQQQLLVQVPSLRQQAALAVFEYPVGLSRCLYHSPVKLVRLDVALGEVRLSTWATACKQARKPVFLHLRSTANLPHQQHPRQWKLKRVCDWLAALILLGLLSPVLVLLGLMIRLSSPGPVFYYQWRVGQRGRLFQIIKFRSMVMNADLLHHQTMGDQEGLHKLAEDPRTTRLGRWLRRHSLDELPQLINVIRGEMSLVGPRPWALYDAVRIHADLQERLNALPGITGAWQVQRRSTLLDINLVNQSDLDYLHHWSLWQDLRFLLLTIPQVISGFGAY